MEKYIKTLENLDLNDFLLETLLDITITGNNSYPTTKKIWSFFPKSRLILRELLFTIYFKVLSEYLQK